MWAHTCAGMCVCIHVHVCVSVCHTQCMYEGQIAGVVLLSTFVCLRTELRLLDWTASVFTKQSHFASPATHFKCPYKCQQASIGHKDIKFRIKKIKVSGGFMWSTFLRTYYEKRVIFQVTGKDHLFFVEKVPMVLKFKVS